MINPVNVTDITDVRRFAEKLAKAKDVQKADKEAVLFLNRYGGFYRISSGGDYNDAKNQLPFVRLHYGRNYDVILDGAPSGKLVRFMTKRIETTLMLSKFSNSSVKGFRVVRNKQ
jgi:hypothetical protein